MLFVWHELKNTTNIKKHGLSFELGKHVFNDPNHVSYLDKRYSSNAEERWNTIGKIKNIIIVVAHTDYNNSNIYETETIRIISARKATKKERQAYWHYAAQQ